MNDSDEKVTAFPIFNLFNIPEALRKVANDIEKNPDNCNRIVLCGRNEAGELWYKAFGDKDFRKLDALGMLTAAQFNIMDCE